MSKSTTKIAISRAFKDLLCEKPFDKITIGDIAARCNINRQTFYYHFPDIMGLARFTCEDATAKVLTEYNNYSNWQEGYCSVFKIIRRGKTVALNLYRNVPRENILNYLHQIAYTSIYTILDERSIGLSVSESDKAAIANFFKFGFVGLITEWMDNGMKDEPEDIVNRLDHLIQGILAVMLDNATK